MSELILGMVIASLLIFSSVILGLALGTFSPLARFGMLVVVETVIILPTIVLTKLYPRSIYPERNRFESKLVTLNCGRGDWQKKIRGQRNELDKKLQEKYGSL